MKKKLLTRKFIICSVCHKEVEVIKRNQKYHPVCAERKHNSYNMAEPSEIMNRVYKI